MVALSRPELFVSKVGIASSKTSAFNLWSVASSPMEVWAKITGLCFATSVTTKHPLREKPRTTSKQHEKAFTFVAILNNVNGFEATVKYGGKFVAVGRDVLARLGGRLTPEIINKHRMSSIDVFITEWAFARQKGTTRGGFIDVFIHSFPINGIEKTSSKNTTLGDSGPRSENNKPIGSV